MECKLSITYLLLLDKGGYVNRGRESMWGAKSPEQNAAVMSRYCIVGSEGRPFPLHLERGFTPHAARVHFHWWKIDLWARLPFWHFKTSKECFCLVWMHICTLVHIHMGSVWALKKTHAHPLAHTHTDTPILWDTPSLRCQRAELSPTCPGITINSLAESWLDPHPAKPSAKAAWRVVNWQWGQFTHRSLCSSTILFSLMWQGWEIIPLEAHLFRDLWNAVALLLSKISISANGWSTSHNFSHFKACQTLILSSFFSFFFALFFWVVQHNRGNKIVEWCGF